MKGSSFLAALGDIAVFVAFVAIGSASHEGIPSRTVLLRTGLPFAIAWFALGGILGLYRYVTLISPRRAFLRAALSWPVAWAAGLALRSWFVGQGPIATFAVVAFVVQGVLLLGWRLALALALSRRRQE